MTATGHRARPPEPPSAMVLSPSLHHRSGSPPASQQTRAWTTGQLLDLARRGCSDCLGSGGAPDAPCWCIWDKVFRRCFARYLSCVQTEPRGYNRKTQEFVADFERVARRALASSEWPSFRRHFILGDPNCPVLDRVVDRVAQAFANTRPYPIFPPHAYFGEPVHLAPKRSERA